MKSQSQEILALQFASCVGDYLIFSNLGFLFMKFECLLLGINDISKGEKLIVNPHRYSKP